MVRVRRDPVLFAIHRAQTLPQKAFSHSLGSDAHAGLTQPSCHADTTIALLALRVNDGHLRIERSIGEIPIARSTLAPLHEATARYAEHLAQSRDRLPAGLCFDPGVLHRDSLTKYAAAFFRISLSVLAEASSRFNRSTSASSSFADRGVAVIAGDDPSL